MKKNYLQVVLAILLLATMNFVYSQQKVVFNTNSLSLGTIEPGAGSMNSCWLMDSDIHRPRAVSNEDRWAEMGLGAVRFPYGHLADNYLWDTPPYGSSPLVPKVASNKAPAFYSWTVNSDKTMTGDLDFDEFMGICQRQNIKPLVVVNALSWKYNNGPTYATLKTTAVQWVKYAKSKGYKVGYWQIGNEVERHRDELSQQEYVALYKDFAAAMKAEDPTAVIGPGIHSSLAYFSQIMNEAPNLVDFASVHQYLFLSTNPPYSSYSTWYNDNGSSVNPNISRMQNAVNASSKPDLPILVTETNVVGNWPEPSSSLYKGLAWFDMLFQQQMFEDVKYSFIWNSHTPFSGAVGVNTIANALGTNNDLLAAGWPIKILNNTAERNIMLPDTKVNGPTYSYGTISPQTGKMTIYLLNKSTSDVPMSVIINNYNKGAAYERFVWTGASVGATTFTYNQTGTISMTNRGFSTTVPKHSLVVVRLNSQSSLNFLDNVGTNRRMKSNSANSDVVTTHTGNNGWLGKWELIDAGNGFVFIQNQANGKRLQGTSSNTGVQTSVKLVDGSSNGSWVQWKLKSVGTNWFITNRAHNTRLSVNGENEIAVSPANFNGVNVQWKLTGLGVFSKQSNGKNSVDDVTVDTSEVLIYPTSIKAGDDFNLNYTSKENNSILELRVMDVSGKTIISKSERLNAGTNKLKVESKGLSQGLYFVELVSNGTRNTKKIVIK